MAEVARRLTWPRAYVWGAILALRIPTVKMRVERRGGTTPTTISARDFERLRAAVEKPRTEVV